MKNLMVVICMVLAGPAEKADQIKYRDALTGYGQCTITGAHALDDGKSNVATIAKEVAARCDAAYRAWLAVLTKSAKPMGVLSNYDMAFETVEFGRSGMLVH